MMRKYLFLLVVFVVAACNEAAPQTDTLLVKSTDGTEHKFTIELAMTPEQQQQGLMHRESMPKDHGMLFVFPDNREASFWMRNTLIPLDMIFIKEDGTIHKIHRIAIPHDESNILSNGPVKAVLEINAGLSDDLGITEGDSVRHDAFKNNN